MKPAICFEMLYPGLKPEEKIAKVAAHGFKYVEFWSWRDKDIDAIKAACDAHGVQVVNFSGQRQGDLVDDTTHQTILDDMASALESAAVLGNDTMMVLTNELGDEGVVVNHFADMDPAEKRANCVAGLKKLMSALPRDKKLVLEPLNTKLDHVGYFLPDLESAKGILEEVDDSRLGILCDFYHQGMMGDDPFELIGKYTNYMGYIHIADYPGRHEPTIPENDWTGVLRGLKAAGYDGYVGFEFCPEGDSDKALERIQALWNSL